MSDYKFSAFGNRLKMLREQSNIKQGQFADKIEISRQSMSNYESGKHCPDVEVLKRMADCLGCSVDYLLGLTEYRNYETHKEFDEDLSILSKALCTIPEPWRNQWLSIFVGTAQWIRKDWDNDLPFHQSSIELFFTLMTLTDYCHTAKEKQAQNCYNEKERHKYSQKRFFSMCQLRKIFDELDTISYNCTDIPLGSDANISDNSIPPELQERINKMKQRLQPKGDE